MVGRLKIIKGVSASAAGALPAITNDDTDRALGAVVDSDGNAVLRYDFNPAVLAPSGAYSLIGKDRGSGKAITAARSAVNKIASDSAFADKPVISLTAGSGDTAGQSSDIMLDGAPRSNFTIFAVASIDSVLKATPASARIVTVVKTAGGVSTVCSLTMLSNGNLFFGSAVNDAESAVIQAANVPAANTPFVIAASYSASANLCKIYLNNSTVIDTGTPGTPYSISSDIKLGIGGPAGFSTGNGWLGKIARVCIFDYQLSDGRVDSVMTALKSAYGIL